ncbi:hypothetical protein BHU72_02860 [Desulfuribacillus stibiiarsenatis]|uniref:Calcineurin-like phosphoesterase domain-containing protein n=1 Tax=Desulfuribacillus stibiiarsenatis TaxID=1390249 RepID=A0A1E5L6Q9_9FIRM|nr:metallophosphoesterase [Desulfuribacillus stibiiarsenatis]OEH85738.1 hypothetical protein BHU72_02860 [Desulfuribacillus stibiiarsenatis]
MAIYGISDLHLSLGTDKPMDVFGNHWVDHHMKIQAHWHELINNDDYVLIPGDISWAMNFDELAPDLEYLKDLPGKKILVRGNHDYWWSTVSKVRNYFGEGFFALQNDSILLPDGIAIAGTRGWVCPNDREFTEHDGKVYQREVQRLELSLQYTKRLNPNSIWVMLHYMPTNDKHERNEMIELLESYHVQKVVYGHLHSYGHDIRIEGTHWGIEFLLISCDYIKFIPKLLYK